MLYNATQKIGNCKAYFQGGVRFCHIISLKIASTAEHVRQSARYPVFQQERISISLTRMHALIAVTVPKYARLMHLSKGNSHRCQAAKISLARQEQKKFIQKGTRDNRSPFW